jgi:signal transduction histidine kinase
VHPLLQSLSSRLLAAFLLPTLVFLLLTGAAGYQLARALLEEELGTSLSALAAATASQLSGERMLAVQPWDDLPETPSRTWRNLSRTLEEVRRAAGARRVLAVDVEGRVRADAGGALPVGAELPELARDRRELAAVLAGGRAASQVLFTGADGQLYRTGYAPVRRAGADSEVVGVVGVEGSAAFFGPLHRLARAFALLAAVALAVLAAVALLTARGLSSPLRRLMAAAERIGAGDLETKVRPEPTREIGVLARELEAMRGALEARDRQMQLMLAGVAHEVRNPLGGMALYAGLLQEDLRARGAPDAEASAHVQRIQQEIDYLQRIVEDFLAFARERPVQRAPLGAPDLVENAVALLSAEAQERGVRLEVRVDEAVLEADGSLLVAALVNLVKNAVQASPAGAAVRVEGVREAGHYLVRVHDTGEGVPEALQARIFEPFFTTRQKGSGLGLALARKVARAHGGELSFRSRPGETVFTLALPLSAEA